MGVPPRGLVSTGYIHEIYISCNCETHSKYSCTKRHTQNLIEKCHNPDYISYPNPMPDPTRGQNGTRRTRVETAGKKWGWLNRVTKAERRQLARNFCRYLPRPKYEAIYPVFTLRPALVPSQKQAATKPPRNRLLPPPWRRPAGVAIKHNVKGGKPLLFVMAPLPDPPLQGPLTLDEVAWCAKGIPAKLQSRPLSQHVRTSRESPLSPPTTLSHPCT